MQKIRNFLKNALLPILAGIATTLTAQDLRVMSYNIRFDNPADSLDSWPHRKDALIAQVAHYAPDVLGTQEGLIHQLEAMETGLEGYRFFGVGRDRGDRALYFSRSPIPYPRDEAAARRLWRLHLGIYAYRPEALARFVELPVSDLERAEG